MKARNLLFLAAVSSALLGGSVMAAPGVPGRETLVYRSEASNEDGEVVYREKHAAVYEGDRILHSRTGYFSPGGELIATLESDYAASASMPTYLFEDLVHGYREGLRLEGDSYVVFKQKRGGEEETRPLEKTSNVFSCQGWHYFLVNNLDLLEKGNIKLDLVLPSELKAYTFQVEQTAVEGDRVVAVVKIDNWFLRLFAPKLWLVYSRGMKKLVEYEGISNIPDAGGERQDVRIVYHYDQQGPAPDDSTGLEGTSP